MVGSRGNAASTWCRSRWTTRHLRIVLLALLVFTFFAAQVALHGRRSGLHTTHLRLAVAPRNLSPNDAAELRSRLLEERRVERTCLVIPARVFPLPTVFVERLHENIRATTSKEHGQSAAPVTVLIVASQHNTTALQLLDIPRLASMLGVPVHLIHPKTTSRPTYGEMLSAAFVSPFVSSRRRQESGTTRTSSCELFFILDPSRLPRSASFLANLVGEFVDAEVRIAAARSAPGLPQVLISCTTTTKSGTIFDRGFNISLGQFLGRTLPAASRNLFGFTAKDQRRLRLEPVDLLSPYCLVLRSDVVQRLLSPLPYANVSSVVETVSNGQSSILQSLRATELLHFGQKFMSEEMVRLSVASLKRMPEEARSAVRLTFAAILDAQKLLKRVNGIRWNSRPMAAVGAVEIEAERRKYEGCRNETDGVTLAVAPYQCMTKLLASQSILVKTLMAQDNGNIPEEFFGWIITLEMVRSAVNVAAPYAVLVSKHEALLLPSGLDDMARRFLTHERDDTRAANDRFRLVDLAAYSLQPDEIVWKAYSATLRRVLPHLMPEAPLRVVWDAYCCHCCGFSNEIVHLVYPLQRRYDVRTPLESSCFCPGFPRAVDDSLVRMYMPKENFAIERVSPHEVTVWVAHSQPTAFQNDIFNVRHPDYIVGRTMYEFTKLTDTWLPSLEKDCDEIWVPAAFVARVFERSGVDPSKIVVIPEALDVFFFDPAVHESVSLPPRIVGANKTRGLYERRHFCNFIASEQQGEGEGVHGAHGRSTLPLEKHFKFFSNFKWESRKGWDILFHAYFSTFRKSEPVSLYVLTHIWRNGVTETFVNRHNQSYIEEALIRVARAAGLATLQDAPHFCVFIDDISEAEMARLYKSSDAFVLPTRGEGWGLPTIQAMSMGLPVISTAWGGQLEFMRKENSFMIPLDGLEEVPAWSEYTAVRGRKWAIPSLRATGELMRVVFSNRSLAAAVGARAREHAVRHFSEEAVVELISQRLEAIRHKVLAKRSLGSSKKG